MCVKFFGVGGYIAHILLLLLSFFFISLFIGPATLWNNIAPSWPGVHAASSVLNCLSILHCLNSINEDARSKQDPLGDEMGKIRYQMVSFLAGHVPYMIHTV